MQKRAYGQACEFCAKRKIKCNGGAPCDSCEKRGRGSSCAARRLTAPQDHPGGIFALSPQVTDSRRDNDRSTRRSGRHARGDNTTTNNALALGPPPSPLGGNIATSGSTTGQPPSQLGGNSMPSFVNSEAHCAHVADLRDMRPALGLQNTSHQYPFMAAGNNGHSRLPFSHAQLLKYSQVYESTLSLLFPFVPRYDDLETLILTFLEQSAAAEANTEATGATNIQPVEYGRVSMLCALLACGAQMSDDSPAQRTETSRGLAQHAFDFARLANWLLRPKSDTIQAMLLLSHFLQNDGQADAAWSLLGTVSRLAMSMGLHRMSFASVVMNETEGHAEIWAMCKWQDCVLSMCFDRPVATSSQAATPDELKDAMSTYHTHADCMGGLVRLSSEWLAEPESTRASTANICRYIDYLDALEARDNSTEHMTSSRPSRRTLIERMTLQLYTGYLRGVMCRPALGRTSRLASDSLADKILRNAISGTLRTMSAFVELSKLTKLPLRTWSMIHAGLSSAIMVEFVEDATRSSQLRQSQRAFLALLTCEYRDLASGRSAERPAWLSAPHLTYLCALQDLLRERDNYQADGNGDDPRDGWSSGLWDAQNTSNETYAQARKNLTNLNNGDEGAQGFSTELENFDWSLMSVQDDAFLANDFTVPSLGF